MATKKPFRCTFEWDRKIGKDDHDDDIFQRHICVRPMHHEGNHKSRSGHTAATPTTAGVK